MTRRGPVVSLLAGHRGIGNGKVGLIYSMKTCSGKISFRMLIMLKHAPVFSEEIRKMHVVMQCKSSIHHGSKQNLRRD